MSWVSRPTLTMAAGATASPLHEDQAGREHGRLGGELLATGLQMATDEGGMLWDFVARWRA